MKKNWKWGGLLLGMVLIAVVLVLKMTPFATILAYRFNPSYPVNRNETISLANLASSVDVYFDKYGIPHIKAQNTVDLARAVGFVQGRYRFFQLDVLRRFGKGRISELVGDQKVFFSTTVEFDVAMRGWGFEKRSHIDLDAISEFDRKVILAFTDGINQALRTYNPVEYDILGIDPEPWEPSDTLIVTLVQCWSVTHNWEQEAVRLALALDLGLEAAESIYPNAPIPDSPTIASDGEPERPLPPAVAPEIIDLFPQTENVRESILPHTTTPGIPQTKSGYSLAALAEIRPSASNAWVVGGKRSKSGKPILANDMHLSHTLPSLIFLQHLKTPEIDIIGATIPGMPFMIAGHNGKVAWGMTSAAADAVDLVVEKPDPDDPGFVLNESGPCELTTESIVVRVRDGRNFEEREFKLRQTCHGPVLNDMYPDALPDGAPLIAIKWELPDVQDSIGHLYRANKAESVEELRRAFEKIPSPIQNIMAADKNGTIAFFSSGSLPVRKNHRGTFPMPGWPAKYQWKDWTAQEQMPVSINPELGYLANTNNKAVDPWRHRPLFQVDSGPAYRFDRIVERIKAVELHDRNTMQSIQSDNKSLRAEQTLPYILADLEKLQEPSALEEAALLELKKWRYFSDASATGATLFYAIYREVMLQALGSKTNGPVVHLFMKQRYSGNAVDLWFKDQRHIVWDDFSTANREVRSDVVRSVFRTVVAKLKNELGDDAGSWHWGKLHFHQPRHLFGSVAVMDFMNLDKVGLAGGMETVWKAHFNMADEKNAFKVAAGPAFRFVVDFGDIDNARFGIDTGESGWPLSPHYGDLYKKWQTGELVPMIYDWKRIQSGSMTRMHLVRTTI
ncbi:MAG: penicillin acylase family protein [Proteobacteria bacterium]|nr:penicillin acylase family protein [Pseudomonadota bacterium]